MADEQGECSYKYVQLVVWHIKNLLVHFQEKYVVTLVRSEF